MVVSSADNINKFNNYIENNKLIEDVFSNIIIISTMIVFIIIYIVSYYNESDSGCNNNWIKKIIYSTLFTVIIILLHNKMIKLQYKRKTEIKGDNEFVELMGSNTQNLINNKIIGSSNADKDIEDFLGMSKDN